MIDFAKDTVFKLKQTDNADGEKMVAPLLTEGERVLSTYKEMRDMVVFTDKRVISVNVQKLTGKKKDFTSLPYAKISVFSVETAGCSTSTASSTCGSADWDTCALSSRGAAISP